MIKGACTRCINVLGPKPLCAYTDYDRNLRIQRSTLQKFADDYDLYVSHQMVVRDWVIDFDGRGHDSRIIADTWRWCLGINKKLPVKIVKQR